MAILGISYDTSYDRQIYDNANFQKIKRQAYEQS